MDLVPLIAAGIGFSGLLLGLILRPWVEEWFARRKKTIHVRISEPSVFRAPHEKVLLKWENETLSKIHQTGFTVSNLTGRTLRGVSLEVQAPNPIGKKDFYSVYLSEGSGCRWEEVDYDAAGSLFEFEYLQPKAEVQGSMISTYTDQIEFVSHDDFEVRVIPYKLGTGWYRYFAGAASAAALASFSTALVAALS
ncbi:hypothetical protein [Erythrobacter litoralis]|uniref:hypothetical protein n=1 Tax=Erythrobacter litoralis TaxID=39960 RepID=UPI0003215B62|nr:hypothetical protein [Erythrobacter litoralis]